VVVVVNGIPLAVIECKSPTLGDKWRGEAIEQLLRYQEIGEHYRELGMPRLFEMVQVVGGVCGQAACYGTLGTIMPDYEERKKRLRAVGPRLVW
jgi:type I restriction enzyme R subunit